MAGSDITVSALTATDDVSGIKLAWTYNDPRNNALPNIGLDMVEVYASATNDRATATKVGEGITDFSHAGLSRGAVRYYWIRARDMIGGFGPWYPSSPTAGIAGTELSGDVLLSSTGYWKLPSGLIFEWGTATAAPNGVGFVGMQKIAQGMFHWSAVPGSTTAGIAYAVHLDGYATSGGFYSAAFTVMKISNGGAVAAGPLLVNWFAVGY